MSELLFLHTPNRVEAGCDEAGRGCLAGPVVAAAVILRSPILGLNDSKKLTKKNREKLRIIIQENALAYSVGIVSPQRIDVINILNASIEAMKLALDGLSIIPEHIIVDGNTFSAYKGINYRTIIKGDSKFQSIAAASILAKTYRDDLMDTLHIENTNYNWRKNKGYPTKEHRERIEVHGVSPQHRITFRLLPKKAIRTK